MATKFDDIIDIALSSIQDYKLDRIYEDNEDTFKIITDGFLIRGLPNFTSCKKPLTYNIETREFDSDFNPLEISIIADLWVASWLNYHINNVTQFNLKMNDSDFKHFSENANLKEKSEYFDKLREKYNQKITDYELNNIDWCAWGNGNYF